MPSLSALLGPCKNPGSVSGATLPLLSLSLGTEPAKTYMYFMYCPSQPYRIPPTAPTHFMSEGNEAQSDWRTCPQSIQLTQLGFGFRPVFSTSGACCLTEGLPGQAWEGAGAGSGTGLGLLEPLWATVLTLLACLGHMTSKVSNQFPCLAIF